MFARGYFTIERNLIGLRTDQIETTLGFRPGRLHGGARVLELLRRPTLSEFELGGTTRYPNRKGLVLSELVPRSLPFAWTNERLVKVEPILPHTKGESYPAAPGWDRARLGASEQWKLKESARILTREICLLQRGATYWGRAGKSGR